MSSRQLPLLVPTFTASATSMKRTVHRHKTAIRRPRFSLPVKSLLRDGKEELVGKNHELYEKFARFVRQEEKWGGSDQILDWAQCTPFCSAADSTSVVQLLPNRGSNCAVVALSSITGICESAIFRLLSEMGARRDGATPPQILLALENLGYTWSVGGTQKARQMTPRAVSAERWPGTWLVFTADHVMPLMRGRVTNFNGCGDEPITVVMRVRRKDNFPAQEGQSALRRWNRRRRPGSVG